MKGRKEDGDRITFIYSLYHGHSIKRSVSSRDDRSFRSQHPHVVSQSFAICGNCRGGLRITEGIESQRLKDPYNLARPSIHLYLASSPFVHRFSHPEVPSFLSFFLSFFPQSSFLHPNKHVYRSSLNSNLDSMRFLVHVKLFRGKIEGISSFPFCKYRNKMYHQSILISTDKKM